MTHNGQSKEESHLLGSNTGKSQLHTRIIEMQGYSRDDGLFEIVGQVKDCKPHDFVPKVSGGRFVPADSPIHEMRVKIVYDQNLVVRVVESSTLAAPNAMCHQGGQELQTIVGLSMTSGWSKEVKNRLSGNRCCTHLMELLTPMATTAYQTLSNISKDQPERLDESGRPKKINSCYAYGEQRELVRQNWPEYYRPSQG